ncbi:hypothetical protein DNU06_05175 [Putridiphycobacter roseus]|uniref:Uncharacterized protein n=1 Tax=Putridiphycobacter roseus TaxID=2219161 RepID=A0A2W1N371_9FLAO|nr:hypothetical protein [Putridiphycobacter roseus]PZE18010.1 hypothetical protein DNU06_05175 [Putridiphycobacter roseus]
MSVKKDSYKSIACSYYDQLEAYATLGKKLKLVYLDENGKTANKEIQIKTFETKNQEEFLIGTDDFRLRLDKIQSLTPVA